MKRRSFGLGMIVMAVLLLILPLLVACDDDEDTAEPTAASAPTEQPTAMPSPTEQPTDGKPEVTELTIKLGNITDKTGVAAQALINVDQALKDNIRYFEDMGLMPEGVTIDLIEYDTQYDPSKFIPAYEWLKEKGADIIITSVPGSGEVLQQQLNEDEQLFFTFVPSPSLFEPPGYLFSVNVISSVVSMYTILDWLSKNDPNFPTDRPARLGGMGMQDAYVQNWIKALENYCDVYPEWELEEAIVVDWTTMTFAPEVNALKDCDYIIPPSTGFALPNFMREYRQAGHDATFLGNDAHLAYYGLMKDGAGWEVMDGMYYCVPWTWYTDDTEQIDIINYVFDNYHTETEVGTLLWSGGAYRGGFTQWYGMLLLIQNFLEENGLGAFGNQNFYEYLQSASITIDGNFWDYSETDRQSWNSITMYQADAASEDIVRAASGWFPVIFEP